MACDLWLCSYKTKKRQKKKDRKTVFIITALCMGNNFSSVKSFSPSYFSPSTDFSHTHKLLKHEFIP